VNVAKIWRDPVFSGIVSTLISNVLGYLVIRSNPKEPSSLKECIIPNWAFLVVISIAIGLVVYTFLKWLESRDRACLSSEEWFSLINRKLKDSTLARIYLRKFDHPDFFQEAHRASLMKIMRTIKARVEADADIKIISFNDNGGKTALDWLVSELNGEVAIDCFVKVVKKQRSINSSSIYLFDDRTIVYNKRIDNAFKYYCESHVGSILFDFVRDGFEKYWRGI